MSAQPDADRPSGDDPSPSTGSRVALALLVGLLAGALSWHTAQTTGEQSLGGSDFDQLWFGARAVLHGRDPYALIGPGREFDWPWPLLYPMPALLAAMPFTVLPLLVSRLAFAFVSAAILTFALTPRGYALLPLLASAAMVDAVRAGQLAPLFAAALLLPSLFWIASVKPNIGLALGLASESMRGLVIAALGGALLLVVSFALQPTWLRSWLGVVSASGAGHLRVPLLSTGGPFLLAALLRWRRFDARVLLAFACVPHTPVVYDLVPLGLIARTRAESLAFALLTYVALFAEQQWVTALAPDAGARTGAMILNLVVYLPLLAMVLSRPNEGSPPAWMKLVQRRPAARR